MSKITKLVVSTLILGSTLFLVDANAVELVAPKLSPRIANFFSSDIIKEGPPRTPPVGFVQDEIIVKFAGDNMFMRVPVPTGHNADSFISQFSSRPDVVYAEPNYTVSAFFVPNDQYYPFQWHFDNPVYGGVEAEQAWDVTNGSGVVVAVIDTGVAYENNGFWYKKAPDFSGTSFVIGYDFVGNDTHPNDDNGHGTHVAGTIAQTTNNSSGVAGLSYGAAIMPIKVLDSRGNGTYADVADGIRFAADNGADVINLSLGGPVGASYLEEALEYAYNKGVVIFAAAGNDGLGIISYPAAYDNYVIAVGATRYDETLAYYSNHGAGLDLVAPGGDLNVDQSGDGYGDGVLQQTIDRWPNRFGYFFYQGTSMATPHAAGAAALILSSGVASTPDEVRAVLENNAEDLGPAGWDPTYGWGVVNIASALGGSSPPPPPPQPLPTNDPPVADAGPDQTVTDSDDSGLETIILDGSGSFDPDGTIVSYEWEKEGLILSTAVSFGTDFSVGDHTVILTVTDDDGAVDSDTVDITVNAAPPPPSPPGSGPTTIFSDNFESGFGGWVESNEFDWNIERPSESLVPGSSSGNRVAHADNCDSFCVITLKSSIDASGYSNITLSFWRFIDSAIDTGEYLRVEIFDGSGWIRVLEWTHPDGDDDSWDYESIDVTAYASSNFSVRFVAKSSLTSEALEIDDVLIEASP